MQAAGRADAANESRDPSARKERGSQDDKGEGVGKGGEGRGGAASPFQEMPGFFVFLILGVFAVGG
jgi:hypothetical protein